MTNDTTSGQPMPEGEEMFTYHGYSGPCPAAPKEHKPNCHHKGLPDSHTPQDDGFRCKCICTCFAAYEHGKASQIPALQEWYEKGEKRGRAAGILEEAQRQDALIQERYEQGLEEGRAETLAAVRAVLPEEIKPTAWDETEVRGWNQAVVAILTALDKLSQKE